MPALLVDFLSPEEMLKDAETRRALDAAIAALPPSLRAAFHLRDVEGLSTAEAAEALSLTEANEATWDRALRVTAGLVLLYLGWGGIVAGGLGTFLKFFGFVPC